VAQLDEHLPAGIHGLLRVVAPSGPVAAGVADVVVVRDHARVVDDPRRVRDLERVAQLVPEHRNADVGPGVELDRDAQVTIAARLRQELRGRGRLADQRATPYVDDQIGRGKTFEDGAERVRFVAAAHDAGREPRVVHAQERWLGRIGHDRCGADEQRRGSGKKAPHVRRTETCEQR
jgi:hypothetical protein